MALTAVQVFNNPQVRLKSETCIVLMHIAWTYVLHAHHRRTKVEYRYYQRRGTRKFYEGTSDGSFSTGTCGSASPRATALWTARRTRTCSS